MVRNSQKNAQTLGVVVNWGSEINRLTRKQGELVASRLSVYLDKATFLIPHEATTRTIIKIAGSGQRTRGSAVDELELLRIRLPNVEPYCSDLHASRNYPCHGTA